MPAIFMSVKCATLRLTAHTHTQTFRVNDRFVVVSVVQDTLATFRCQLDAVESSVEAADPRAVEQSSGCIGSG